APGMGWQAGSTVPKSGQQVPVRTARRRVRLMEQFERYHHWLLGLPRSTKQLILLLGDLLALSLVFVLAYAVRVGSPFPNITQPWLILAAPLLTAPCLYLLGFYRGMVRHLGGDAVLSLAAAMSVGAIVLAGAAYMLNAYGTPRSVFIIY